MELHYSDYDFYSTTDYIMRHHEDYWTGISIGFGEDDQVLDWWGYGDFYDIVDDFTLIELYKFIVNNISKCDRGEGEYSNEELLTELLGFIKETKGFELDKISSNVLQA